MRYIAAYLLAELGGNTSPTAQDIQNILTSVGVESDQVKLGLVMQQLGGKNIEQVIAEGINKLAVFTSGGPAVKTATDTQPQAEQPLPQLDQPVQEDTEESDDDLGFGLFD